MVGHFIIQTLFLLYLVMLSVFSLPYLKTEAITIVYAKGKLPSIPDFTTINRRINRLRYRNK